MPDAPPERSRREADAALDALRRAVETQPHGTICLAAPAGPPRSHLLQALEARLGPAYRTVRLTQRELSPAGLWVEIVRALGFTPGYDARHRVLHHLADLVQREMALVLLVEDADALPADTLASLVENARAEIGLHLVLAAASERSLAGRLPEDATTVHFDGGWVPAPPPAAAAREPAAEIDEAPSPPGIVVRAAPSERPRRSRRALWGAAGVVLAAGLALLLVRSAPSTRPEPAREGALRAPESRPVARGPESDPIPAASVPPAAVPAPAPSAPAEPAPASEPSAEGASAEPAPPTPAPAEAPVPPPAETEPAETEPAPQPEPSASAPAPEPERESARRETAPPEPERAPPLSRGALRIESESPVMIEIDGRPYGRTPLAGVRLPRGEHRVIARYPDGATALKTVALGDAEVSIFFR